MITCSVRLQLNGSHRDDGVRVLRSLLGPVRCAQGCLETRLLQETAADGDAVTWHSAWRSRSDFERHLRSLHFRRVLAVMELASEAPSVEVAIGDDVRGFDLIEELLATSGPQEEPPYPIHPHGNTASEEQGGTR